MKLSILFSLMTGMSAHAANREARYATCRDIFPPQVLAAIESMPLSVVPFTRDTLSKFNQHIQKNYGDYLLGPDRGLYGSFEKTGSVLTGFSGSVRQAAWSPEGNRLLITLEDGRSAVFDAQGNFKRSFDPSRMPRLSQAEESKKSICTKVSAGIKSIFSLFYARQLPASRNVTSRGAWQDDNIHVVTVADDAIAYKWNSETGDCVGMLKAEDVPSDWVTPSYSCQRVVSDKGLTYSGALNPQGTVQVLVASDGNVYIRHRKLLNILDAERYSQLYLAMERGVMMSTLHTMLSRIKEAHKKLVP